MQFTVEFELLWESPASAQITGSGAQAATWAVERAYKVWMKLHCHPLLTSVCSRGTLALGESSELVVDIFLDDWAFLIVEKLSWIWWYLHNCFDVEVYLQHKVLENIIHIIFRKGWSSGRVDKLSVEVNWETNHICFSSFLLLWRRHKRKMLSDCFFLPCEPEPQSSTFSYLLYQGLYN